MKDLKLISVSRIKNHLYDSVISNIKGIFFFSFFFFQLQEII